MNLKKCCLTLIIVILFSITLQAEYRESYTELFFGRQPSSRAESMGRSYVCIDGDLDAYFYNPAGLCNIENFDFKFTTSSPFYINNKARYYQIGLAYNWKNSYVIGFNINHFNIGESYHLTNEMGETIKKYTPYLINYTLTIATNLSEQLNIGINTTYFIENYSDDPHSAIFFDAG
jgi:hypothetical protein